MTKLGKLDVKNQSLASHLGMRVGELTSIIHILEASLEKKIETIKKLKKIVVFGESYAVKKSGEKYDIYKPFEGEGVGQPWLTFDDFEDYVPNYDSPPS